MVGAVSVEPVPGRSTTAPALVKAFVVRLLPFFTMSDPVAVFVAKFVEGVVPPVSWICAPVPSSAIVPAFVTTFALGNCSFAETT